MHGFKYWSYHEHLASLFMNYSNGITGRFNSINCAMFPQYGFIAWLLSTCVGLLLSFLRYGPCILIDHSYLFGVLPIYIFIYV